MAEALRIFFSTTDHSGDEHAAALIRGVSAARPGSEFAGLGGPRMAAAGCRLIADTVLESAMWFDTLRQVPRMWGLVRRTARFWREWGPAVFVPIDSPGINFPLARRARRQGIRNVYFIPPQVWAWGRWRLRKLRRLFDELLVALPFEQAFYASRGLRTEFVGHPLFDDLPRRSLAPDLRAELGLAPEDVLVGLLPGSRGHEVSRIMPILRDAAHLIRKTCPRARYAVGAASADLVPAIEAAIRARPLDAQVLIGRTLELMRDARLCLVASGTATLQLLYFGTPMVVVYRLNPFEAALMGLFKRSRYVALVNVLADREVVPELVRWRDCPEEAAAHARALLADSPERAAVVRALAELRSQLGAPGALERAAAAIIEVAERPSS